MVNFIEGEETLAATAYNIANTFRLLDFSSSVWQASGHGAPHGSGCDSRHIRYLACLWIS